MAITTAGGGGSGTGSLAANTATNVSLFSTPATTNAIFIVTVTASMPTAPVTVATIPSTLQEFSFRTIVGPSTAVALPLYNAYAGGAVNYAYSYQWCSIVFS